MTVLFLAVDLALFFNQYVNPIAMAAINWKYYIVYTVWLAFEFAVVWKFYIETRNTPLEEIVKYFDGEGAIIGGEAANEKSRQLESEIGESPYAIQVENKNAATVDNKEATL
jgi:hypothetical protein